MTFLLDLSNHQYQETFEIGHGWNNPTTITRRASLDDVNQNGLIGIMELTDLFFQTVQEYTGHSIIPSNNLVISNNPTFMIVKVLNQREKMGWKETTIEQLENGATLTRRIKITINPEFDQKEIPCSEALLIEKMGISHSDTVHEWTLNLNGMNQTQSFTLRTKEQEIGMLDE